MGLFVVAIFGFLSANSTTVFADSITATFDYNTARIAQFLPSNMVRDLDKKKVTVTTGFVTEPIQMNSSIANYYDYVWTVDGQEIDLNTYQVTKSTTFVAKWEPIKYSIYYMYPTEIEKAEIDNLQLIDEYSIEKPVKFYKPNRDNYVFIDWYSSLSYNEDEICMYTSSLDFGDKVIYAKWQPIEYSINYHTDAENRNNPISYNVESPDYYLEDPYKEGHIFKGWYLDENCNYPYTVIEQGSSGNLDLYPLWELEKFTIKYILPNGTKESVICEYGKTAKAPNNYNSIFEIVVYDGDRHNITEDAEIRVK